MALIIIKIVISVIAAIVFLLNLFGIGKTYEYENTIRYGYSGMMDLLSVNHPLSTRKELMVRLVLIMRPQRIYLFGILLSLTSAFIHWFTLDDMIGIYISSAMIFIAICCLIFGNILVSQFLSDRPYSEPEILVDGKTGKLKGKFDPLFFLPTLDEKLLKASTIGNKRKTKWLLKKGADVNTKSIKELNPIHCAARYGHYEICELLIEYGAELDDRCPGAPTFVLKPSYFSKIGGNKLDSGIESGTPLFIAEKYCNKKIAELLREKGAKVK